MGKGNTPDAPKMANQQFNWYKKVANYNKSLNAGKTVTPWGSSATDRKGNVKVTLSPQERALYDATSGAKTAIAGTLPTGAFEMPDTARADEVEKALYDRRVGMISPELDRADAAKRLELMDRGIPIGSEIYTDENDRLNRNRANALAGVAQDATLAGGQESDRILAQALTLRNQPFNEFASVTSAAPVQTPQVPNRTTYGVQAPDLMGAYGQQAARDASKWQGLFGLGTAAFGFGQ